MFTILRRASWWALWLGLAGGAGFAGWSAWQRRNEPATSPDAPSWPPFEPNSSTPTRQAVADTAPTTSVSVRAERWVAPVDGACPEGYSIKANENSGIYHQPGGRFYARTIAERCYANEEDAVADGYRAAKS